MDTALAKPSENIINDAGLPPTNLATQGRKLGHGLLLRAPCTGDPHALEADVECSPSVYPSCRLGLVLRRPPFSVVARTLLKPGNMWGQMVVYKSVRFLGDFDDSHLCALLSPMSPSVARITPRVVALEVRSHVDEPSLVSDARREGSNCLDERTGSLIRPITWYSPPH
jgi:hypothetical protein